METPSTNMREWQNFNESTIHNFGKHIFANQRTQGVVNSLGPRVHFLFFATGQVAKLLAPDSVEGAKNNDFLMLAAFQHSFESSTNGQSRLTGSGPANHRDDTDVAAQQHINGQTLFGRATVQPKDVAVPTDHFDIFMGSRIGLNPAQCRTVAR